MAYLKQQILLKKNLIAKKREQVIDTSCNLAKIDKYEGEKIGEGKYYQEVFKAFKTKLTDDQKNSGQNL